MPGESDSEHLDLEDTLALGRKAPPDVMPAPEATRRIGAYRLLQIIGEGGMGEVWLAEQDEPRRKVALKLIKAGMDTKQVVARFESERQALALMDHPAIAKVFDAGSTAEGRPYFVMEYVAGIPITEHCDTQKLSTSERLQLFCEVCEGVQHAHQKAIIHRDLKPSNILVSLVDGKAQAKIIDFGIAKATGYRLTEKTLFTEVGALIGTPEYMSPEQADLTGQDVDTRTDVYSLGVLLYQLLTGELPFGSKELRSSSYDELRRVLNEVDPPRPSTKLSTLGEGAAEAAKNRLTDPGALRHQLEGDLDAITMKALEKQRVRRYGTPSELAADIGRYLGHEPVVARAPSTAYRLQKYIKRHRVGVGVAIGLTVLLVAFAATMAVQARRTALERDRANREREASDKVSAFLANMLSSLRPEALGTALWQDLHRQAAGARRGRGASDKEVALALGSLDEGLAGVNPTQTASRLIDEQILERAGKTLTQDMGSEPRIAGSLEYTLARTYESLGLYPQAEQHAKRAVELRTAAFGPEHPDTLAAIVELANIYGRQGHYPEAEKLLHETLDTQRRVLGPEHPDVLRTQNNLAIVYKQEGRYGEAEKLYKQNLESERRVLGPEHKDTLGSMNNLAYVYMLEGRYDEAEKLGRETAEAERRLLGPEHPATLGTLNNLALVYDSQGRYNEAEKLYQDILESERRVLGPEHSDTLHSMSNLGAVYMEQGRYDEAEKLYRETMETERKVLGPEHPDTLSTMSDLAVAYMQGGRLRESEKLLRETLEAQRRILGREHPDALGTMANLALVDMQAGRFGEAAKLLQETVAVQRRVLGPENPQTLQAIFGLATAYDGQGRYEEAQKLAQEAVTGYERQKLQDSEDMGGARMALGWALMGKNRFPQAEKELIEAERLLSKAKGVVHKKSLALLVATYEGWEESEPGKGHAAQAMNWKSKLDER
jgi:eukaryotic-like serine/threonine-protein kinase